MAENRNRIRNYIFASIGDRSLTNELTLVLQCHGVPRKIAKILFRPGSADFYIALPYLPLRAYRCGVLENSAGELQVTDTNANVRTSRLPVKLSFHESGQVHARSEVRGPILAEVRAVPIVNLSGQHVFTIELEGIANFAKAKPKEIARPSTVAIELLGNVERVQLVGYVGRTQAEVAGKYSHEGRALGPTFGVRFDRPTLITPLFLGVYLFTGQTLQTDEVSRPLELAICGFEHNGPRVRSVFVAGDG